MYSMIFICFLALKGEKKEIFVLINHFPTLEGAVCILDGCNTWLLAQLVPTPISDQDSGVFLVVVFRCLEYHSPYIFRSHKGSPYC
jgi:hypothetical protein